MSDLRKAAEKAIKMIDQVFAELDGEEWPDLYNAKNGLKEALAQSGQEEPVAWIITTDPNDDFSEPQFILEVQQEKPDNSNWKPLYTTPQSVRRLSDEDISDEMYKHMDKHMRMNPRQMIEFANAIMDKCGLQQINKDEL